MARAAWLAVLLATLLIIQAVTSCQAPHQIRFYVFGFMGCPCRDLKERLISYYGEEAVVFNEVSEPENAEKLIALYSLLYPDAEGIGVPVTIVVIDGEPAASVIGAMPDAFWTKVIDKCIETGEFVIFDGEAPYVIVRNLRIIGKISEIIGLSPPVDGTSSGTSIASSSSTTTSVMTDTSRASASANRTSFQSINFVLALITACMASIAPSALVIMRRRRGRRDRRNLDIL